MKGVNFLGSFIADESGQGVAEYGAVVAFAAVLIAVVAGFMTGGLKIAISTSFSTVVSSLNAVNSAS